MGSIHLSPDIVKGGGAVVMDSIHLFPDIVEGDCSNEL